MRVLLPILLITLLPSVVTAEEETPRPNFVLCLADDLGWGDVGYRGYSPVQTPVLDEMARTGVDFQRFYAAAPVCSPTRASLLTGRHPNRTGCLSWGHFLRPGEETLAEVMARAGYRTGHFGKWHIGKVGKEDPTSPGGQGFQEWCVAPNFFEVDPLMSRGGDVVQLEGEGSEVTVDLALEFIRKVGKEDGRSPFFVQVWFGSPHQPHEPLPADRKPYSAHEEKDQNFYGEITAMDRAMGRLRRELRTLGIEKETVVWFLSDNGALKNVGSAGNHRGRKGSLREGGILVPSMLEWPSRLSPRKIQAPCGTVDVFPTVLEFAGIEPPEERLLDGVDLTSLVTGRTGSRGRPLGFWTYPVKGVITWGDDILRVMNGDTPSSRHEKNPKGPNPSFTATLPEEGFRGEGAWIDGSFKLLRRVGKEGKVELELFDVVKDPGEEVDLVTRHEERVRAMERELTAWQRSVARSCNGKESDGSTRRK